MATKIVKQRIYRKYANFPKAYRIIHVETSSDIVMRADGTTIEDHFKEIADDIAGLDKLIQVIQKYFKDGVLTPEHGGTGGDNVKNALYKIIFGCASAGKDDLEKSDLVGIGDVSSSVGKKVTINDLAQFIATLITTKPYIISSVAPANTEIIWIDSANSNIAKIYDKSAGWIAIKTAWA